MTTIGTATLQIIPSLLGVTDAIEKQIDGKVIGVTIEPQVDKTKAQKAGKEAGEAVTKEVNEAVRKGDIGKTINDEITTSAKKSSAGKEAAKVIVDGIADGVKGELRDGSIGEVIVDGIADGVKQGIDGEGIGGQVVDTIGGGIRAGNLGGTIKDTVLQSVSTIGSELRAGAADWSSGIAGALRSGDIQGATDDIGNTVRTTTDTIATIGSTFGLQLEGVRVFGEQAGTTLSNVGGEVQGMVDTALNLKGTFEQVGDVMGTVLPGKAATGAQAITTAFAGPLAGLAALNLGVSKLPKDAQAIAAAIPGVAPGFRDKGADAPWYERDITMDVWRWLKEKGGHATGGFTGNFPINQIAGVVHGGEHVIQATSRARIENAYPGLLDFMNNNGRLPGYEGGGRVAYGLPAGTNTGGYGSSGAAFPDWVHEVEKRFGVKASTYPGHQERGGLNKGIDWVGSVDAMQAFAEYLKSIRGDLEQVIWMNPKTGQKIGVANGQLVGPGTSQPGYYSSDWAGHANHVHTRQSYSFFGGSSEKAKDDVAPTAVSTDHTAAAAADVAPAAAASSGSSGSGVSMPSSISGLSSWGLNDLGKGVGKTSSGTDLSGFGEAAGAAVSGQVASALDVFGVGDSPGWLKGISTFVSGISVSDSSGKSIFDGSNLGGRQGSAASAAPLSAKPTATGTPPPDAGNVHGSRAGQRPGPQTVYNIRTATVEDAYVQAKRLEDQRALAKLNHL